MRDESFEKESEAALSADEDEPVAQGIWSGISVPREPDGRRRARGIRFLRLSASRVSPVVPLAAALLVVVLAGAVLMSGLRTATVGPGASATVTAGSSAVATATATANATATTQPSAQAAPSTVPSFPIPGATSAWTGFSWQKVPVGSTMQVIASPYATRNLVSWDHGYAALGSNGAGPNVLLTSPDGETWTQIAAVQDPYFVAVGPGGLVLVDQGSSGDTIWTSADGTQWHDAGRPAGVSDIQSIAGTAAGLVATGQVNPTTFGVVFSTDGVSWAPVAFKEGAAWDDLGVLAGQGRFFVLGGSSETGQGGMWWSDDGWTWTRSTWTGFVTGGIPTIKFTSSGMLSWTGLGNSDNDNAVEIEISHDGGKTWLKDPGFGPLGSVGTCPDPATCQSDGYIGSNGSIFLAVNDEGKAWTSSDGIAWKQIQWNAPEWGDSTTRYTFIVLPRGVLLGSPGSDLSYGSAAQGS